MDLNGKVAIRARGAEQSQITELVLNRSGYSGPPIRINTNRRFLGRALELGFGEIGHLGRGVALGLPGRAPDLRLAAAERRCGHRAG